MFATAETSVQATRGHLWSSHFPGTKEILFNWGQQRTKAAVTAAKDSCMEAQLEMEDTRLKEVPAEGENRKETRWFTLQLGSVIAQWVVLLACVIGIAVCYLKIPDTQPQWVHIKLNISNISMKHVAIKREEGTMNILNRSISIRCDGHYLFFLKGTIHLQRASDSLMLSIKKSRNQQNEYLLKVACAQKTEVQEARLSKLSAQDNITLEANQTATSQDLSLVLIMLTPQSYCHPGN